MKEPINDIKAAMENMVASKEAEEAKREKVNT